MHLMRMNFFFYFFFFLSFLPSTWGDGMTGAECWSGKDSENSVKAYFISVQNTSSNNLR